LTPRHCAPDCRLSCQQTDLLVRGLQVGNCEVTVSLRGRKVNVPQCPLQRKCVPAPPKVVGGDVRHGGSGYWRRRLCALQNDFQHFVGIDWGSEKHRVCLMDRAGRVVEQR